MKTIEEAFGRDVVQQALERIVRSRRRLCLGTGAFVYGSRIFGTPCIASADIDTMSTDGVSIWYNPKFTASLTKAQVIGVLVHELLHIILLHPFRFKRIVKAFMKRYGFTKEQAHIVANQAMDYGLNPLVIADGYKLPEDVLLDKKFNGMHFEKIMHELIRDPEFVKDLKDGKLDGGPGVCQPFPGDPDETKLAEHRMKSRVMQDAMAAKAVGNSPAWLDKLLAEWADAQVNWVEQLAQIADYIRGPRKISSWDQPHRHYIQHGVYVPRKRRIGIGTIVGSVDVSGSVSDAAARIGLSEFRPIVDDCEPQEFIFMQFDTEIKGEPEIFQQGEKWPDGITRRGCGGTRVTPQFKWLEERGIRPSMMLCITDGEVGDWPEDPGFPVIWLMTTNKVAPFGHTIHLKMGVE